MHRAQMWRPTWDQVGALLSHIAFLEEEARKLTDGVLVVAGEFFEDRDRYQKALNVALGALRHGTPLDATLSTVKAIWLKQEGDLWQNYFAKKGETTNAAQAYGAKAETLLALASSLEQLHQTPYRETGRRGVTVVEGPWHRDMAGYVHVGGTYIEELDAFTDGEEGNVIRVTVENLSKIQPDTNTDSDQVTITLSREEARLVEADAVEGVRLGTDEQVPLWVSIKQKTAAALNNSTPERRE